MANKRATRRGGRRPRKGPKKESKVQEPITTKITPFGLFMYQEGKLIKTRLWGKDPVKCAEKYFSIDEEVKSINNSVPIKAKRLKEGVYGEELLELAIKNHFKEDEFKSFFQKFSVELTKLKLKFGFKTDKLIIQAVNSIEETTKMLNLFYERLSEWYGFYFPEAVKRVESIDEFVEIVGQKRTEKSMGYDLPDKDLNTIKVAGEEMKSLLGYKEKITKYLEELMAGFAPNLAKVAGSVLGAKLIAATGSLEKLAKMTSSTVQVLGAEKALFRHIRKGARPPKYGYILQHNLIKKLPVKDRGKFARTLAGKISIAVKVDFQSQGKGKVWEKLNKDLESRISRLKK